MKIAILGYGSQGASAYEYFLDQGGHELTICDKNENVMLPNGANTQLGKDWLKDLDRFDLLIRAPSLHPRDIIEANPDNPLLINKITSNTNIFVENCPTSNIVGVTGTKGKGTTSTLISNMLEAAGKNVHLGGNIGIPPLDMLKENIRSGDWVVLELANYQLIDLKKSPLIAVCVVVEPEHLDWHTDLKEYIYAKQQLFRWQTENDAAIYFADSDYSREVASISPGRKLAYYSAPGARIENNKVIIEETEICSVEDIGLPGKHNWQNVCAAVTAVWQITQDASAIKQAISELKSLPFRIEFRAEKNGVKFYNDSFATASGATIAAIEALTQPKVLILGGYERGSDLTELVAALKDHQDDIRKLIVIGQSADRVIGNLRQAGVNNYLHEPSSAMNTIVKTAYAEAQPGDVVLLSPAFASFDMYKNFEERGQAFNRSVEESID